MGNNTSVPLRPRRRRHPPQPPSDLLPPPELQYLKPSGLYPTCQWDPKTVRRLILRAELAPRYPGLDDPTDTAREECPICMLVYPVLNETRCCQARLCTECYLQIRPPRHNKEPCPFCKYKRVEATFKGPRDKGDIEREEMDEKRAAEAMKRANLAAAAMSAELRNARDLATGPPPQSHQQQTDSGTDTSGAASSSTSPDPRWVVRHSSSAASSVAPLSQFTFRSRPCDCPDPDPASPAPVCPHHDDYRSRYYHDKAPGIDPLLLEAMASEVTFASPPGSAADRASASSSGRLDLHVRDLRADVGSESDAESMSYLAEVGHRVVRLPWYGVDVDRAAHIGPGPGPGPVGPSVDDEEGEEEMHHVEKVSLNEAIRRSLIEM